MKKDILKRRKNSFKRLGMAGLAALTISAGASLAYFPDHALAQGIKTYHYDRNIHTHHSQKISRSLKGTVTEIGGDSLKMKNLNKRMNKYAEYTVNKDSGIEVVNKNGDPIRWEEMSIGDLLRVRGTFSEEGFSVLKVKDLTRE